MLGSQLFVLWLWHEPLAPELDSYVFNLYAMQG